MLYLTKEKAQVSDSIMALVFYSCCDLLLDLMWPNFLLVRKSDKFQLYLSENMAPEEHTSFLGYLPVIYLFTWQDPTSNGLFPVRPIPFRSLERSSDLRPQTAPTVMSLKGRLPQKLQHKIHSFLQNCLDTQSVSSWFYTESEIRI